MKIIVQRGRLRKSSTRERILTGSYRVHVGLFGRKVQRKNNELRENPREEKEIAKKGRKKKRSLIEQ